MRWDADNQRDHRGNQHQHQLEGRREALAEQNHGVLLVAIGDTEVSLRRMGDETRVLGDETVVQPRSITQLRTIGPRCLLVDHFLDGIAEEANDHEG